MDDWKDDSLKHLGALVQAKDDEIARLSRKVADLVMSADEEQARHLEEMQAARDQFATLQAHLRALQAENAELRGVA